MSEKKNETAGLASVDDLEIEPLSEEDLESVAGGASCESNSCSTSCCSTGSGHTGEEELAALN